MDCRWIPRTAAAAALLSVALTGCADDGAQVRSAGDEATTGSGTGSGSDAGSGSGLSPGDVTGPPGDAGVQEAAGRYEEYVRGEVDALAAAVRPFTDAVRAGDVEAAREAYAPSRVPWERIEPVAGLVEELDGKLDARVDDFASVDDPEFTGWHRLEYLLFERDTTKGARRFADQLDADVATLQREIATLDVPPRAVALGAGELVEEVSKGKITGEEERYSGTDLWDIAANLEGSRQAVEAFSGELREREPALLAEIDQGLDDAEALVAGYRRGEGYAPFSQLAPADKDALQARTAALAESLSRLPAALGIA